MRRKIIIVIKSNYLKNDIRNTWKIMKKIIDRMKCNNEMLPKHLIVDEIKINNAKSIAKKFHNFFVNIGPNLISKIGQCDLTFKSYLPTANANSVKRR